MFERDQPMTGAWYIATMATAFGLLLSSCRYGASLRAPGFARLSAIVATALIGGDVVAALAYLLVPQYIDHIEPQVIITALNAHQGMPLYPDWSKGEGAYGLLYGPLLYAAVGVPLFASKTVVASKLVSTAAFLVAIAAIWYQAHRSSKPSAPMLGGVHLLALVPFGTYAFWVRAEPLLLAIVAGATMAMEIRRDTWRWLVLGICAGLAVALKAYAPLYFIPLGALALLNISTLKATARCIGAGAAGFIAAAVAVFAQSPRDVLNLGMYIAMEMGDGIDSRLLRLNAWAALAVTAPYAITLWQRWQMVGLDLRTLLMAATTAFTIALLVIVGAKPSAGPYYLIPLIPVLLSLALRAAVFSSARSNYPLAIATAGMVALAVPSLARVAHYMWSFAQTAESALAQDNEAADLALLYPRAQFGPTDDVHYRQLDARIGAARRGARLIFSVAPWMDFVHAGITPRQDTADFASPGPSIWILPREGAPFSLNDYSGRSLFSRSFQQTFRSRCHEIDVRETFAAWRCETGIAAAEGAQ